MSIWISWVEVEGVLDILLFGLAAPKLPTNGQVIALEYTVEMRITAIFHVSNNLLLKGPSEKERDKTSVHLALVFIKTENITSCLKSSMFGFSIGFGSVSFALRFYSSNATFNGFLWACNELLLRIFYSFLFFLRMG